MESMVEWLMYAFWCRGKWVERVEVSREGYC